MRVVFLAPLLLAGCAEVAGPVQNPIPAPTPAIARPAPAPAPSARQTAPKPAQATPARSEAPKSSSKPRPLPDSVVNAVNKPSSSSNSSSSSSTPTAPTPAKPQTESCKEGSWWGLVGRPRTAASIVSEPKRVYTEGDPVTADNVPNRTNIVLDAEGKIAKVTCG